jgi:hypothetical protein
MAWRWDFLQGLANNNNINRDSFRFGINAQRASALQYRPCTLVLVWKLLTCALSKRSSSFLPSTLGTPLTIIYTFLYSVEGRNDERLLDAHVKSSRASTKVHGRYCSAEARCALIESKNYLSYWYCCCYSSNPWRKETSTPSHILARVQPHDNSRLRTAYVA